jgi:transcriptional regulator with XRE-family HTH domain
VSLKLLFAERLEFARKNAGLSQRQLGILAGMDEFSASARMNQYAKGKHLPDLDTAWRLADILGLPMAYFYCPEKEAAELLCLLKSLPPPQQQALLDYARQLKDADSV